MLPFLKNKQEGSMAESEDEGDSFGTLDAIAQDMMEAFDKKDKSLLKAALESLCDYLKEEDVEQDQLLAKE